MISRDMRVPGEYSSTSVHVPIFFTSLKTQCRIFNGSFTLHGTGNGTGTGTGMGTIENNGYMYLSLSLCSVNSI